MCSTAECGKEDVMVKGIASKQKDTCFKCKTNRPFVVIRHGDPFCETCFDTHVLHKFRQGLGKTKILYPGEVVLLDISGSISSLAMLRLMASGYDKSSHKKITANPKLIVVDESNMFDQGESPVPAVLRAIEACPHMPSQTFVVPFEMAFAENCEAVCRTFYESYGNHSVLDFKEADADIASLAKTARATFDQIRTLSAREDVHRSLRLQLLYTMARVLGSSKIMLPSTATDLAARLLTSVAVGRGSSIPNEVNYLDTRIPGLTFINCMRDFTPKECVFYLKRVNVSPITVTNHVTLSDPIVGSVSRLSDTFISGLQISFPSTVSTVLKTAAKLRSLDGSGNCSLCMLPLTASPQNLAESPQNLAESPQNLADVVASLESLQLDRDVCLGCEIALSEGAGNVRLPRTDVQELLKDYLIE